MESRTGRCSPGSYYGAGGNVISVQGLADAKEVIEEVAQQGEGRVKLSNETGDQVHFGQPKEVAHFYKFEQILAGRHYDGMTMSALRRPAQNSMSTGQPFTRSFRIPGRQAGGPMAWRICSAHLIGRTATS